MNRKRRPIKAKPNKDNLIEPPEPLGLKLPTFKSEPKLQQAIAGLLSRMPGVSQVQMIHGAQEFGKDIIFQSVGAFGETIQCACVIKNHRITAKVTERSSTRAILYQIEQALDTSFLNHIGAECPIERVYVISPEEISQSAVRSIAGKLRGRAGQVIFIGGGELFRLFKTHWVDFFTEEYSLIGKHMDQLTRKVSRNAMENVANNYKLGPMSKSEGTIYVSRIFQRKLDFFVVKDVFHLVDAAWKTEWRRADIDALRKTIFFLKDMIAYLSDWGFWAVPGKKADRDPVDLLDNFMKKIEILWRRLAFEDLPEDGYDSSVTADTVVFPNQDSLEEEFTELLNIINESLSPLRSACAASNRLPSEGLSISILSDPYWRVASAVNDFARYSPIDLLRPRAGIQITCQEPEVLSYAGPLLIVGAAGYGKTSFCRWHALSDTDLFRRGESSILPVYVLLNDLVNEPLETFEGAFLSKAGKSALLKEASLKQASAIRLYLDGLDEISNPSQRRQVVDLVKKGPGATSLVVQIILTARDYVVGREFLDIPRVELAPLTEPQLSELTHKWFRQTPHAEEEFWKQLDRTPSLAGLIKVPLLATLTLLVFRHTGKLPESKVRLYTWFVELLSGGWDLAKGTLRASRFGQSPKIIILRALAASVHAKRLRHFAASEIISAVEASLRVEPADCEQVLEELVADGVIARSGESYFFSHLSFQEFLSAWEFRGDPRSIDVNRAIKKFSFGDDWWSEVLRFYIELADNPHQIAHWLVKSAVEVPGDVLRIMFGWVKEAFPEYNLDIFLRENLG